MTQRTILVTHVEQYAGPGAVSGLVAAGYKVFGHDPSFADPARRSRFHQEYPNATPLAAQEPKLILAEMAALGYAPHALVVNAAHPITPSEVDAVQLSDLRATFESVVLFPVGVVQAALPALRGTGSGTSIVMITSARERRPEPGFSVPTSLRAATTAFAKSLAIELAPVGIQVNVIAPNYLESEMYYPAERYVNDPRGRAEIAARVPMGRLGKQAEVGELVAFLASGRAPFVTGQVIAFTGGWAL